MTAMRTDDEHDLQPHVSGSVWRLVNLPPLTRSLSGNESFDAGYIRLLKSTCCLLGKVSSAGALRRCLQLRRRLKQARCTVA